MLERLNPKSSVQISADGTTTTKKSKQRGSILNIKNSVSGIGNSVFLTMNGAITWRPIVTLTENLGSYDTWTVPTVGKTKIRCKVKVSLRGSAGNTLGSDVSDAYSTIEEK